jgi:hypothetical protein
MQNLVSASNTGFDAMNFESSETTNRIPKPNPLRHANNTSASVVFRAMSVGVRLQRIEMMDKKSPPKENFASEALADLLAHKIMTGTSGRYWRPVARGHWRSLW